MELTKEKLNSLWKIRQQIFANQALANRFGTIDETINKLLELKSEQDFTFKLKNGEEKKASKKCFGPARDNLTADSAFSGVFTQADEFTDISKDLIIKTGCMLGGFDFTSFKMNNEYRIISNTFKGTDDFNGSLTSTGQSRHPSSHFADNNYFFTIAKFLQEAQKGERTYLLKNSALVLRYPNDKKSKGYYSNKDIDISKQTNLDQECTAQQEVLEYRFPPKFLWMWANKDKVLHPYSLMAFRNFLTTEYGKEVLEAISSDKALEKIVNNLSDKKLTPENVTNMKFDDFIQVWKKISTRVVEEQKSFQKEQEKKSDDKKTSFIDELSKLISIIMTEETDIKNISDLLTTGNKAVILWGPPGTGKTYESEQVVKELLNVPEFYSSELFERIYNFSIKKTSVTNISGYYEIVQFHPNYTYQDFIGGIAPKLDGNDISYELKEGIFKRFCDEANKKENENKKYIFIIDEINRAELSAVFGELLYALEYRGKPVNLPNFNEPFTIPKNVYIIGTMNNVDKSLVTFDLALRRRFGFFKLMPKLDVLEDVLSDTIKEESLQKYIEKCKVLNEKIVTDLELGKDYQIGQAYFFKITDFMNKDKRIITSFELEKLWAYNIEPLLEEYLGMNIEDDEISKKLKDLKEWFEKI
jgi:MoxR-like ATPase